MAKTLTRRKPSAAARARSRRDRSLRQSRSSLGETRSDRNRRRIIAKGRWITASSSSSSRKFRIPRSATIHGSASTKHQHSRNILLHANTGKPMQLDGFPLDVVVDMNGHRFAKATTPVLGDHKTDRRFGHTHEQITVSHGESETLGSQRIKGPAIAALATRSSQSDYARDVERDMRSQFPFQVSIGTRILDAYVLEEGDSETVNGRKMHGPLIVASETETREITVTVLGADGDTSATIAAGIREGEPSMKSWKLWLKAMGHADERTLSTAQRRTLKAQYKLYEASFEIDPDEEEEDDDPASSKKGGTATKIKASTKKSKTIKAADPEPDEDEEDDEDSDEDSSDSKGRVKHQNRIAAMYAEAEDRVDGINAVFNELNEAIGEEETFAVGKKKLSFKAFKSHAIRSGMDVRDFELQARRASYYTPGEEGRAASIHAKSGGFDQRCVEIGILRAAGIEANTEIVEPITKRTRKVGFEHLYADEVLEASDDPKYRFSNSIDEILDLSIRANGYQPTARHGSDLMIQAHKVWNKVGGPERAQSGNIQASGFSTLYLTNIFENVLNKSAEVSFQLADGTWREWVGVRSVSDFKPVSIYVLNMDGNFKKVAQDGELKHITLRDSKRTLQAETYGAMITIDRKTRINDDLGLIVSKASTLGTLAAVRIEESVYVLLLSNAGSFFSVGNGNIMSGAGSVLGIDALTTAQLTFRMQTLYGKQIVVRPSLLLTGLTLGQRAQDLFTQGRWEQGLGMTGTSLLLPNNPHVGRYRPVVSGWIDNTGIRDEDGNAITGQTATQSYIMAPANTPQGAVMQICFLNGRQTPFFDQAETQFNIPGGIQMRSYLDWGVGFGVPQLGMKLVGA